MLHRYLKQKSPRNEDLFFTALKNFLRMYEFGVVDDTDFWKVFSDVSGEDIEAMMTGWVTQKGFPMVEVKLSSHEGIRELILTQKRFLLDKESDPDHTFWDIPIEYYYWHPNCTTCKNRTRSFHLKNATKKILGDPIAKGQIASFPIFNPGQYGYYIVKYCQQLFSNLMTVFKKMDVVDKIMILSDTSLLVQAREYEVARFLSLLAKCVQETDVLVQEFIEETINSVRKWLENTEESRAVIHDFNNALKLIFDIYKAPHEAFAFVKKMHETAITKDYTFTLPKDDPCIKIFENATQSPKNHQNPTAPQIMKKFFKQATHRNLLEKTFQAYSNQKCKSCQKIVQHAFVNHFNSISNSLYNNSSAADLSALANLIRTVFIKSGDFKTLKAFMANHKKLMVKLEPYLGNLKDTVRKKNKSTRSITMWTQSWKRESGVVI